MLSSAGHENKEYICHFMKWQEEVHMFGLPAYAVYILIFIGKMIEVTFSTLRVMFSSKGNKGLSAACGFMEIFLWINIASTVLTDMQDDPIKMVIYCVAFSCGIPFGIAMEQKLAVGLTSIQIVCPEEGGELVAAALRENNFGVTILEGHSVDGTRREMIFVQLKRKRIREALKVVRSVEPSAIISASDVKSLGGGFMI